MCFYVAFVELDYLKIYFFGDAFLYIVFLRIADVYVASCVHFYRQMVVVCFQYHIHSYIEITVHHHLESAQLENMNNL